MGRAYLRLLEGSVDLAISAVRYSLPTTEWAEVCRFEMKATEAQRAIHAANIALLQNRVKHAADIAVVRRAEWAIANLGARIEALKKPEVFVRIKGAA